MHTELNKCQVMLLAFWLWAAVRPRLHWFKSRMLIDCCLHCKWCVQGETGVGFELSLVRYFMRGEFL